MDRLRPPLTLSAGNGFAQKFVLCRTYGAVVFAPVTQGWRPGLSPDAATRLN
jgi:hypothetical protein